MKGGTRQLWIGRFVSSTAASRIHQEESEIELALRPDNSLPLVAGVREDRPVITWLGDKSVRLLIGPEESIPSHCNS